MRTRRQLGLPRELPEVPRVPAVRSLLALCLVLAWRPAPGEELGTPGLPTPPSSEAVDSRQPNVDLPRTPDKAKEKTKEKLSGRRVRGGPENGSAVDGKARWQRLDPEKRKQIQALYEELAKLPPEDRAVLLDKLRALGEEGRKGLLHRVRDSKQPPVEAELKAARDRGWRDAMGRLPPSERERVQRLTPEERRKYFLEKGRETRARAIELLPEPLREEVRKMAPADQAKALREHRGKEVFLRTFPDPAEVERLRALPHRRVLDGLQLPRASVKQAPTRPDFVSVESWARWTALRPFEKARVLEVLVGARPRSEGDGGGKQKRVRGAGSGGRETGPETGLRSMEPRGQGPRGPEDRTKPVPSRDPAERNPQK